MTTDSTTPSTPEWVTQFSDLTAPAPTPAPAPRRRRVNRRLLVAATGVTVLVAGLATISTIAVKQDHRATRAETHAAQLTRQLEDTRKSLMGTRTRLSDTKDELSSVRGDYSRATDQLAVCADVTKVGQLLFSEADHVLAGDMSSLNLALDEIQQVTKIVKANGFTYIDDLFEACDPTTTAI